MSQLMNPGYTVSKLKIRKFYVYYGAFSGTKFRQENSSLCKFVVSQFHFLVKLTLQFSYLMNLLRAKFSCSLNSRRGEIVIQQI